MLYDSSFPLPPVLYIAFLSKTYSQFAACTTCSAILRTFRTGNSARLLRIHKICVLISSILYWHWTIHKICVLVSSILYWHWTIHKICVLISSILYWHWTIHKICVLISSILYWHWTAVKAWNRYSCLQGLFINWFSQILTVYCLSKIF
jgi:hypothetical protein